MVFSKLLFFAFFEVFGLLFSGDFGLKYTEIHIPIHFHF